MGPFSELVSLHVEPRHGDQGGGGGRSEHRHHAVTGHAEPELPVPRSVEAKLIRVVTMLLTRVSAQRALGAAADLVRVHGGRPRHLPRPRRRGLRIRQEEVRE